MADSISAVSSKKASQTASKGFNKESMQHHEMKKHDMLKNQSIFNLNAHTAAAFIS